MYGWSGWLAIAGSVIQPALAQDFPTRPVRIIVGFPPGGGADLTARLISPKLNEAWARPVIIDNRPGAGGNLAAELVAKASPDGHTIMVMPGPGAPSLYPKLPFDLRKDFAPITLAGRSPNVLVVHPSVPASTVKELIALGKSQSGKLNYASSGVGITPHLSGELPPDDEGEHGTRSLQGAGPAVSDLVGGHVDLMIVSIPSVLGQINARRLKALRDHIAAAIIDVAWRSYFERGGVPGYESHQWWSLLAPAGTPAEIVMKLNAALVKALNAADVRKRFAEEGAEVVATRLRSSGVLPERDYEVGWLVHSGGETVS